MSSETISRKIKRMKRIKARLVVKGKRLRAIHQSDDRESDTTTDKALFYYRRRLAGRC